MGPKDNHMYPYKREVEGTSGWTHKRDEQKRRRQGATEEKIGEMQSQAWSHQKLDKARNKFFLKPSWLG